MGSPITWRSVTAPNFGDSNRLMQQGQKQVLDGINSFGKFGQGEADKADQRQAEYEKDQLGFAIAENAAQSMSPESASILRQAADSGMGGSELALLGSQIGKQESESLTRQSQKFGVDHQDQIFQDKMTNSAYNRADGDRKFGRLQNRDTVSDQQFTAKMGQQDNQFDEGMLFKYGTHFDNIEQQEKARAQQNSQYYFGQNQQNARTAMNNNTTLQTTGMNNATSMFNNGSNNTTRVSEGEANRGQNQQQFNVNTGIKQAEVAVDAQRNSGIQAGKVVEAEAKRKAAEQKRMQTIYANSRKGKAATAKERQINWSSGFKTMTAEDGSWVNKNNTDITPNDTALVDNRAKRFLKDNPGVPVDVYMSAMQRGLSDRAWFDSYDEVKASFMTGADEEIYNAIKEDTGVDYLRQSKDAENIRAQMARARKARKAREAKKAQQRTKRSASQVSRTTS